MALSDIFEMYAGMGRQLTLQSKATAVIFDPASRDNVAFLQNP